MEDRKDAYREALRQARADRARLLKEVEQLENLIKSIEGFLGMSTQKNLAFEVSKAVDSSGRFQDMTLAGAATVVLKENNRFMHISDIADAIVEGRTGDDLKKLKRSLYPALQRAREIIKHPEKSATFGLREWNKAEQLGNESHPE